MPTKSAENPLRPTFINVDFKQKDAAKALGARWDGAARQWYVPEGRDLAPFAEWMTVKAAPQASTDIAVMASSTAVEVMRQKGMQLSVLLMGVGNAVSAAYRQAVWTIVEVVQAKTHSGHVYLEVSERDATGKILAKAQATIWASTAQRILPAFEQATGACIGPGIKLLVSARPVFKAQHGFSLDIEAVDPDFTLGELEARKREIRARLQAECIFGNNKQLAKPWDYNRVLVVAPANGAGLGDFQKEAQRLQDCGVCHFVYVFSRFQGDGAAHDILTALNAALSETKGASDFDAVVIIRGGGAINDLAYLNDYPLARFVCLCAVPVLTGIGHERDNTLLDEVAHSRFDTPSKVINGIEQVIAARAANTKAEMMWIVQTAAKAVQAWQARCDRAHAEIQSQVVRQISRSKEIIQRTFSTVQLASLQCINDARESSLRQVTAIRQGTAHELAVARSQVPALLARVQSEVGSALERASLTSDARMKAILDRAAVDTNRQRQTTERLMAETAELAVKSIDSAAASAQALIREITGQRPEKTLNRGFVIVRSADGKTASRASQLEGGSAIELQFGDGHRKATIHPNNHAPKGSEDRQ